MKKTVTIEEAARLSGLGYMTMQKRLKRRNTILLHDPKHKQRRLVRVSDLSAIAQDRYMKEKAQAALAEIGKEAQPGLEPAAKLAQRTGRKLPQGLLDFNPKIPNHEAIERTVAAVPEARCNWVERWCNVVGMCTNGNWQKYASELIGGRSVKTKSDFVAWLSHQHKVSIREIYRKVKIFKEVKADPTVSRDEAYKVFSEAILPKPRPGRESIFDKPGNEWMCMWLRNFYLNQTQFSVTRAWQMLCEEIDSRQRAWKLGHLYEKPTLRQCRTMLRHVPTPEETLGRLGQKAYNDRHSPYISRDPESIKSNDIWVTDQKQIDVRLRGAGEQLGRIWMVSFMDARSWKIMGYWFGPVLSSDMVISAAELAIERHGLPGAIQMDLGKEFACTAFSGSFRKIKGETLLSEAQGLCQRLGINVIKAIGCNPQTKPIERWHSVVSEFDKRIPGWCGRSTGERPEVLAELERHHQEWKSTARGRSPLFTIHQYLQQFVNWIENDWNAKHRGRGKYLRWMTPNECWKTHMPVGGPRRISPSELALATADHRVLKVARGGQINITVYGQTLEFQAPELFLCQGQKLEVIISRTSLSKVTVLDKARDGRFLCEAAAKPLFHWGQKAPEEREELRQAIRIRNAAKKAINLGNAARRVLEATVLPVEIGPQHPPMRQISSTEFKPKGLRQLVAPRTMTAGDLARHIMAMQEA